MKTIQACALVALAAASLVADVSEAGEPRTITPMDLVTLRDIGGLFGIGGLSGGSALSVSPDGAWVAFQLQEPDLQRNTFRLTWYVLPARGTAKPHAVGEGGELMRNQEKSYIPSGARLPQRATWSPDSKTIYYLRQDAGGINVWRSSIDGGSPEQMTHADADVLNFRISDDGARVLYSLARPRGEAERELASEAPRGYLFDDRFVPYMGLTPLRHWCGEGRMNSVNPARECVPGIEVLELSTQTTRAATDDERTSFDPPSKQKKTIGASGRAAWLQIVDEKAATAPRPLVRLHAQTDRGETTCLAAVCAGYSLFDWVRWSANGQEVYFLRFDLGSPNLYGIYAWNPKKGSVRTIIETGDLIADCQVQDARAICIHESAMTPRRIVSIELRNGRMRTLYDPNPAFRDIQLTRVETLGSQDAFGNPVHGKLVYPRGYVDGKRYPVIVMPYDATGFLRGDMGDEYPAHVFAAAGFMALCASEPFDVAARSRANPAEDTHLRKRTSTLSSIENILDELDRRGLIDPKRVGMTGLSDGAQQVHFAVINTNRIAAAALSSFATPWSWYYMEVPRVRIALRSTFEGIPAADIDDYRKLSYTLNAQRITTPLLVNVSDEELEISVQEFAALQDAGKPVEMHVFPDEHHIKWQPEHRLNIYRRNVQWFRFWLMGEEDPDPVDPSQYDRWRKLRALR